MSQLRSFGFFATSRTFCEHEYTRKYVLQEQQLESFFEKPLKEADSPEIPTGDISARRIDRLNSTGLAGIYGRSFRNEVARRILDGNPISPANPDEGTEDSAGSVTGAALIEELKLKSYRSYPARREFSFGSMNLLVGPNGTGKTSLLEAMADLALGGTTWRSDSIVTIFTTPTPLTVFLGTQNLKK